jgi:site-specific DNA recombinase
LRALPNRAILHACAKPESHAAMRTLIYARYSSDLQNSRSIEDQVAVCAERAAREGWPVVGVFEDAAISGAAGMGEDQRPGLNAMIARIKAGGVDQVLAESTSRIARHEGDSFAIREQFKFLRVRLFTLSDGEVDDFRGTIRALLDAQQRRDTAANVRRGQRGTVRDGRIAAGLAYGYRLANEIDEHGQIRRGLRAIDEDKAAIVRRIFAAYAAGIAPREIALQLNSEDVPSPSGREWSASTILGDSKRGSGLLKNALYVGRIVHNRTQKVSDPETRRELIRPNEAAVHITGEAPHLRIIDEALWQSVQDQITRRSSGPRSHQRRPRRLLSGLCHCGICGGPMIIVNRDMWGCPARRAGRPCTNTRMIKNDRLEALVLGGLQQGLVAPEIVEEYVAEYGRQRARRAGDIDRERRRIAAGHDEAARKVERLIEAIANGADEFEEVRDMMRKARAERDSLAAQLAAIDKLRPLALHPSIARDYRAQVAALGVALTDPIARAEAVPQIRALIGSIIATPRAEGRSLHIDVNGRLANILKMAAGEPISGMQREETERLAIRHVKA